MFVEQTTNTFPATSFKLGLTKSIWAKEGFFKIKSLIEGKSPQQNCYKILKLVTQKREDNQFYPNVEIIFKDPERNLVKLKVGLHGEYSELFMVIKLLVKKNIPQKL